MTAGRHDKHYLEQELHDLVRSGPEVFEFLQRGSMDGIWYRDVANPEQEWMSPRFKELFGYRDHEIPNTSQWWQKNIFPEDLPVALENFTRHCADPDHPCDQVVRYRHKAGSTVWVRCRGMAIRDGNGKAIRLLGCHTDITALKQAEEQVRRLTAELEAANQELGAFAHSVSHDLRQPLRAMDGFSKALLEDYGERVDDQGRDYLERIRRGAQLMGRLIDDVLKLSRMTRIRLHREPTDLSSLANDIVAGLRDSEPMRDVSFGIAPGVTVDGDAPTLRVVLENLLANAWKFTSQRPRARIEFGAVDVEGEHACYVRDDGVGFDMAYAHNLFKPFQRLHAAGEFAGTGTGLATVERIIRRHGGRCWAEGAVGRGATVYFTVGARGEAT